MAVCRLLHYGALMLLFGSSALLARLRTGALVIGDRSRLQTSASCRRHGGAGVP